MSEPDCLALAGVLLLVWIKTHDAWANLIFSIAALMAAITGEFFAKTANDPVWIGTYSTDLKSGTEADAGALADTILKQLKTAGFFPKR